jgi:hypothetical protein
MVKAINKLAIQASYGAKRNIAFQSLISLQLQFCTANVKHDIKESKNTNNRMSRIVTKLFTRVLSAEDGNSDPFSTVQFDMVSMFASLEDTCSKGRSFLASGNFSTDLLNDERMSPFSTMVESLIDHIVKTKHQGNKLHEINDAFDQLEMRDDSFSKRMYSASCTKHQITEVKKQESSQNSEYLSELISAVGDANGEKSRAQAIDKLRNYLSLHPSIAIEPHLNDLSAPFQKYLIDQIKRDKYPSTAESSRSMLSGFSSRALSMTDLSVDGSVDDTNKQSVSEKLRSIKSKINAAEATANSVLQNAESSLSPTSPMSTRSSEYRMRRNESTNGSSSRLRERLAAANEKRGENGKVGGSPPTNNKGSFESSVYGNAAALRARLESVRRMNSTKF